MKKLIPLIVTLFAWGMLIGACSAQQKQEAAKDAYLAQQMDCVKAYDNKPEIDACRARVREAWGLAPDAGKDGSK